MSARFQIVHQTEYRNATSVLVSNQALHLQPRELEYQHVLESKLIIDPLPASRHDSLDYFGNPTTFFTIGKSHQTLQINCRHQVRVDRKPVPDPEATEPWDKSGAFPTGRASREMLRILEFRYPSPGSPFLLDLRDWSIESFQPDRPGLEAAIELNHRIFKEFTFDSTATVVSTPLEEVLKLKRGVCQDFAQLAVACFRSVGLPARYVSGYLKTLPPPGEAPRFGADASHAWCSVYFPQEGWIDLDPTNDKIVDNTYITLGWGRDYSDVSLIRGVLSGGGPQQLYLAVDVAPLDDDSDME